MDVDLSRMTITSGTDDDDDSDSDRNVDGTISMSTIMNAWNAVRKAKQAAVEAKNTFDRLSNKDKCLSNADERLSQLYLALASASTQLTNAIDERTKTLSKLKAVNNSIEQTKHLLHGIENTIDEIYCLRDELIKSEEMDTEQTPQRQQPTVVGESNSELTLPVDSVISGYYPIAAIGAAPMIHGSKSFASPQMSISYFSSYAEFVRMDGRLAVLNEQFIKQGDVSAEQIEKDLKMGRGYLLPRSTMSKVIYSHFRKISGPFEQHINAPTTKNENHKGLYQGITWPNTCNLWQWVSNEEWVVDLVARVGPINVIDAGSGLNSPCINATYTLGGMIKVAIGIEGDQHKACVAAHFSKQ